MRNRRQALASALGLATVMVACSGSSDSVDSTVTPATIEALTAAYCDKAAECGGPFVVKVFLGDVATCKSRLRPQFADAVKAPGAQILESQADKCKRAIAAWTCKGSLDLDPPECDIRGMLEDGTSCAHDLQCKSGACFVADAAACGKCGPRVPQGGNCTSAKCERGFSCSDGKKCITPGGEGAACDTAQPCQIQYACFQGKCVKGAPAGASCTAGDNQPPCDTAGGLYCKPDAAPNLAGKCTAFREVAPGAACGVKVEGTQVTFDLCTNGQCVGAVPPAQGQCRAYIADGASCTEGQAPGCLFPSKCRNGKCSPLGSTACGGDAG